MTRKGTALITGGSRRIGREIALTLARRGWSIALHYRHSRGDAEQLAGEIQTLGVACELFCGDLSDMNYTANLIAQVMERRPDLNVLINNASIFERMSLLETEEDFFDRHFNLNFKAPFFLVRDFARQCKQGAVINLLDAKITQKFSNYFAYTLTK
ncbi:SDR family NAD(P)-dependent oxidoreductase, partial [bacterium]|nr:SDR family NAD(P)-dependent oxidoreductase [bacterium]